MELIFHNCHNISILLRTTVQKVTTEAQMVVFILGMYKIMSKVKKVVGLCDAESQLVMYTTSQ